MVVTLATLIPTVIYSIMKSRRTFQAVAETLLWGWGSSFLTVVYGDLWAGDVGGEETSKEGPECHLEGPLGNITSPLCSGGMESGHEINSK